MKKKFLSAILSAIVTSALALTLTACGEDKEAPSKENSQGEVSVSDSKPDDAAAGSSADPEIPSENISSADTLPGDDTPSEAASEPDHERPTLIESRIYVSEGNHSDNYRIDIYDNGGWSISQEFGNLEIFASYSYDDEAAGNYVTVQSYNLAFDPPENKFEGNAKFKMTEETLEVMFDTYEKPEVYVRHSLDEPLDF